jgi:hypothetical protein
MCYHPFLPAVHFVGKLLEGTEFVSTRDKDEPFTFKLGTCEVFCLLFFFERFINL